MYNYVSSGASIDESDDGFGIGVGADAMRKLKSRNWFFNAEIAAINSLGG